MLSLNTKPRTYVCVHISNMITMLSLISFEFFPPLIFDLFIQQFLVCFVFPFWFLVSALLLISGFHSTIIELVNISEEHVNYFVGMYFRLGICSGLHPAAGVVHNLLRSILLLLLSFFFNTHFYIVVIVENSIHSITNNKQTDRQTERHRNTKGLVIINDKGGSHRQESN